MANGATTGWTLTGTGAHSHEVESLHAGLSKQHEDYEQFNCFEVLTGSPNRGETPNGLSRKLND